MHQYLVNKGNMYGDQPPAQVKQMNVSGQQVDPRMLERAYDELSRMQQTPMSSNDGVTITIGVEQGPPVTAGNYTDAYTQQGQDFSRSVLGQAEIGAMQDAADPQQPGKFVKARSADILSQALMGARDPNSVGQQGYYDVAGIAAESRRRREGRGGCG